MSIVDVWCFIVTACAMAMGILALMIGKDLDKAKERVKELENENKVKELQHSLIESQVKALEGEVERRIEEATYSMNQLARERASIIFKIENLLKELKS